MNFSDNGLDMTPPNYWFRGKCCSILQHLYKLGKNISLGHYQFSSYILIVSIFVSGLNMVETKLLKIENNKD